MLILKLLKLGYVMDKEGKEGKEIFGDTCKETDELNEILEKHLKPLWEKYLPKD